MRNKFIGVICLGFFSLSAPAFSDISVEEVWADTKKWMLMDPSTAVTFGVVESFGDRLVAKDIRIVYDDDNIIVTAGIEAIEIKEAGDGSVELIYPEVIPISLSTSSVEEAINIDMELDLGDFRYVVDGTPKDLTYTVNSPKIQISIVDFGALKKKIMASAVLTIRDLKGTHRTLDAGDLIGLVSNLELGSIVGNLSSYSQESGEGINLSMSTSDIEGAYEISLPSNLSELNPKQPFHEDMEFDLRFSYGNTVLDLETNIEDNAIDFKMGVGGGSQDFIVNKDNFEYQTKATDLELSLLIPDQLPFPVSVNAQTGFGIKIPLSKKEGDFELSVGLRDLYVNNELWDMFDPEKKLPRTPATLALKLSGVGNLFFNALDPEQAEELSRADIPGEIKSISLDELDIQGVGLEVTGDGLFVFDNDDLITIPGIPRPKGSAEVQLIGGNTFIDTLINIGLLTQDEAMQARMMLMLFAKPDPSVDDKLTSRWEITEDGQITANGQRLR